MTSISTQIGPSGSSAPRGEGKARGAAIAGINGRLESLGNAFRLARVMGASGRFLMRVVPCLAGMVLIIGFLSLPSAINLALAAACAAAIAWWYWRILHQPLFAQPTFAQIARWVETNAAERGIPLSNELINAVLLAEEYEHGGKTKAPRAEGLWIPALLNEIDRNLAGLDLQRTVPWRREGRAWLWAAGAVAATLFVVALFWPTFAHGMSTLAHPGKFVPRVGQVKIVSVEPGNDAVLAGQAVGFTVTVDAPGHKAVDTKITLHFAGGAEATYPMNLFGDENNQYRYQLASAAESLEYVITAGDSQSERFRIEVIPEIHLATYRVTATPPLYTGRDKITLQVAGKDLTAAKGSLEVPTGSTVEIAVATDIAVHEALLDVAGAGPLPMTAEADGRRFSYALPIRDPFRYAIRINDAGHRTLRRFPEDNANEATAAGGYFTLTTTLDNPPTVQETDPGRDLDARPGDTVPLAATCTDDYGLTQVHLETAKGPDTPFVETKRWDIKPTGGKTVKTFTAKYLLALPSTDFKFGDLVRYRFVAIDNRDLTALSSDLGPQTTQGEVFAIHLNDTAAETARSTKLWEELRAKLSALLDREVKMRAGADAFKTGMTITAAHTLAAALTDSQTKFRSDLAALAKDFPFEAGMKIVQKSLQVLATEDCTEAVDRASDITGLTDARMLSPTAAKLRQHQSRIIDVLQALIGIAAEEEKRADPVVQTEGGEVPNDAKEAWKKLADDLQQFEKEQKKVIDTTADLAKKPKDQFDKDDQEKLKNAATVEDKWEKFLSQRLVDMSKIAEQDQANVALLDEMVQMKIELAMAKDALQTQATQIATPLEENGLENAKSLSTHIERWLEQQPDRTKWEMEEATQQNETPMAELPKQLQDMMGDLMDQEEDLTDDMESQASKFADSLDKGAGWGAADGPISNMSAQGVTGNQMPKNNEIQGRSGEGREGRASGEFVGAEAEGKGGRRTPTRMTPEPFSQGQVDDKSTEPAGGATGGGKKAGWGGEGLEGPGPDSPKDPNQRLAGRQAALRNEAERLQIQAHAQGFENFKLIEASVYMQRAEDAMKKKQYDNALYFQQESVQSLNTAKVLAAAQVHVTLDTTPTMSQKTQKEIQDALNGVMPNGFADPVKAYFERLSNTQGQ